MTFICPFVNTKRYKCLSPNIFAFKWLVCGYIILYLDEGRGSLVTICKLMYISWEVDSREQKVCE